jgi:pimeloyl-ACP methyl ester carboxylesterase
VSRWRGGSPKTRRNEPRAQGPRRPGVLAVLEAGDPNGPAVVVHHGTPGSSLLWRGLVEDAEARGIRLLGYDRPGYGGSDPHPGRSVADAADDVAAIADGLVIERLAVEGGSGGGPHALACAALLPERVAAAASLAGVAPYSAEGLHWLDGMGQDNLDEFAATLAEREELERFWRNRHRQYSPPNRRRLRRPCVRSSARRMRPCARVRSRPVQLWHGAEDRFVPIAHGRWLAERIPGVDARLLGGKGLSRSSSAGSPTCTLG